MFMDSENAQVLPTRDSKPIFCLSTDAENSFSEIIENPLECIRRSETQESVVAATETDGGLNHQIRDDVDVNQLFDNLAKNKDEPKEELDRHPDIDCSYSPSFTVSEDVSNLATETETKLNIDSKTQGSINVYGNDKLQIKIELNNRNVNIEVSKAEYPTIKKRNVQHPDNLAYSADKTCGNCLLNAVCLDKDIQGILPRICKEFQFDPPENGDFEDNDSFEEKYNFLYKRFQQFFKQRNPRMTKFNFLSQLSGLADVTHLCGI